MKKLIAVLMAALIIFIFAGCVGGVDTSTDPDNMLDYPAVNEQREREEIRRQRREEALKDLCPYDRSEWGI